MDGARVCRRDTVCVVSFAQAKRKYSADFDIPYEYYVLRRPRVKGDMVRRNICLCVGERGSSDAAGGSSGEDVVV